MACHRNLAVWLVTATLLGCGSSGPGTGTDVQTGTDLGQGEARAASVAKPFPSDFRFGAASSAHQVEGGQTNNWTLWETLPQFDGQTVEPSGLAVDHYNRYEEDFDLARSIGLDTLRFSIEWSRVEPDRGSYDEEEIAHYHAMFDALKERGISPSVTLHHFTEPQWFTDLTVLAEPFNETICPNGPSDADFCFWSNPDAPGVFAAYCGLMAERFGGYVDEWMTVNELTGYWIGAAVMGHFPPGLTSSTEEEIEAIALPVLRGLLQAHAECYRAIHEKDTIDADGDGLAARVGLTTGTGMIRPADPDNADDVGAAAQGQSLASYLAFDAVTTGMLDADFDGVPEEHHPEWENTMDILGLQYYASTVVVGLQIHPMLLGVPCTNVDDEALLALQKAVGCPPPPTLDFPLGNEDPPELYGRQHDPEGLVEMLRMLTDRYPGLPMVITENGFADYDDKRTASIVRHLEACHQAIEEGIPLEGYYHWSLLDNFEWGRGFDVRFGLFHVDYDGGLARSATSASQVYGEITAAHGLTEELIDKWGGTGPLEQTSPWSPDLDFPYCPVDEELVEQIIDSLDLDGLIGQHIIVRISKEGDKLADDSVEKITAFRLGGVFVGPPSGIEMGDPAVTARFIHDAKKLAYEVSGVPIFVCLDQEGGANAVVNSLTGGTDTMGNMPIGVTRDPQVAFEQFDIMGREIAALGFNMDLGPVLDTLVSTTNGNLNTRPFGPDPDLNATLGVAAIAALQHNLVLAVGKHFPGDGVSSGNTHKEHVLVDAPLDYLEATLLGPFRRAVAAGVDGMMTIPAAYTALDPERSAITSRKINTGLLREEMEFPGLIVTDALGMVGATFGLEQGQLPGVEALRAGADILLYVDVPVEHLELLIATIKDELEDGGLSQAEFLASTRRIIAMKQRYCLFEAPVSPDEGEIATLGERIGRPTDRALSQTHADLAPVLLHDNGVLPLTGKKLLYVGPDTIFSDPGSGWINVLDQTFGEALSAHAADVESITYFLPMNPSQQFAAVLEKAEAADVIVLGTLQGRWSLGQQQLTEWILGEIDRPVVHVILGVPFDYAMSRERAAAAIALMGSRSVMVEAGAAALFGKQKAPGEMLFDLDKVTMEGPGTDPDDPSVGINQCEEQEITCSGGGLCVDTGAVFGCVCHPNYHPAPDGLDCVPDGS